MQFQTIGSRIKYLRENILGLTQEAFGDELDLSAPSIHSMETGKRRVTRRTQNSICSKFDVSRLWLESGDGAPPIKKGIAEASPTYDHHGGYKPDPEKALGMERDSPQWKALAMLSTIYTSGDQPLIDTATATLRGLAAAADRIRQGKRELAEMAERLREKERVMQAQESIVIRHAEVMSGADGFEKAHAEESENAFKDLEMEEVIEEARGRRSGDDRREFEDVVWPLENERRRGERRTSGDRRGDN